MILVVSLLMNNNHDKTNFIILGGGAAGILLAMKLAKERQKMGIHITLIDCKVNNSTTTPSPLS